MDAIKKLFSGCLTVPNLLSVIRILLIPVFGILFYKGYVLWAVVVLAISGLTDFFDGKIARKFNQISELGKMLDPVADKMTQITIAIVLFLEFNKVQDNQTMIWFKWVFLFFVAKELLMVLVGAVMIPLGLKPSAAVIYGKVATFVFYGVMVLVFAFGPEVGALKGFFTLPDWLMVILVIISAALTFVALLSYVPGTVQQFKERKQNKLKNQSEE